MVDGKRWMALRNESKGLDVTIPNGLGREGEERVGKVREERKDRWTVADPECDC